MRITQEADYALRILLFLSGEKEIVSARAISESVNVPPRFTLKILSKLVSNDLARSYKGANGGYVLSRSAESISLLEVIEAIDGKVAINRCLEHVDCPNSEARGLCRIRSELGRINGILTDELSASRLSEL